MNKRLLLAAAALSFSLSVVSVAHASNVFTLPLNTSGSVNSYFDHTSPNYSLNGTFTRYDGQVYTGSAASPSSCSLGVGCYDGHNGIDFQASAGTAVYAAADGVVQSVGWENPSDHSQGFGYFIRIWHSALSDSTLYGHLTANSETTGLGVNSSVSQNATIAQSGNTGNSTGAHLHFSVFNANGLSVSNSIDPFGWSGSGSDPWTIDQGYLWTTNPPSHTGTATPGNISVTSAGVSYNAPLAINSGASLSYQVQNTGQQSFSLSNLDMQVAGPGGYSAYLGSQSLTSLAGGGTATYSFSAANFLAACSTCTQGTYTFYPKYRDTGGTVHDVLYAGGGSAAVSLSVLSPIPVTSLKLNSGNTELFAISQSGAFLRNETVGVGPGGWSGWNQPLSQSVTFTGRVWPVINSQGYEEVFVRDTSGNLWRAYNSPTGWHAWTTFGSFQTPSDPSAIGYDGSGNLELYVLGNDGNRYHNWEGSFESWSGFYSLGNNGAALTGTTWPAKNSAGKAEVFVRDTSGSISNAVLTSGGWSWHGFGSFQTPSAPTALRYDAAGDLELYVRGNDGNVYHNWEGSLGNWSGFSGLGNGGGVSAIGPVWPIVNGGRAQLFMRDGNNHLWTDSNTSSGWSGWSSAAGSYQSIADPTAVLDYHGYPYVLFEGTDSHQYQAYNATGSWSLNDLGSLPSSSPSYAPSANRPVPLKLSGGSMELFNVSSLGQVLVNKTTGSGPGGWGGWSQISPTTQTAFYVGRPWTVINSQGYEEVFVRDSGNAVWRTYNTASGWHQWEMFTSFQSLSDPVAVSYNTGHDLALFLRGTDNTVYYFKETSFNTWAGYTQAPTASLTLGGGIWAVANSAGNPELFVRDTSGNIWYIANPLNSSSTWQQFGSFQTPSDPTAVPYATNGYLEVYVRGTDGSLYHNWENSPGSWSGFASLGNGGTSFVGPAWPIVNGSSRPQVFVRDSSNHVWSHTNVPGGWSGWSQVGTYQSITDPTAALDANGYPELFIEGNDGNLYQSYYSASAWSGWTSLGNPN